MSISAAGIVSLVIFLVVGYSCFRNGLFSTLVTLFVIVLSSALALALLGPLTHLEIVKPMAGYAPPIFFLGVFILGLVILQTVANFLYPPRLAMPKKIDLAGGAILGLVNALFLTGVLMVGWALFPGTGNAEDKVVFLGADVFFAKSMERMSAVAGGARFDADKFLAEARQEKFTYRLRERKDEEVYSENSLCAGNLRTLGIALNKYVEANKRYPRTLDDLKDFVVVPGFRGKWEEVTVCPATKLPYKLFPVTDESIVDDKFILMYDAVEGLYGHREIGEEGQRTMGKRSVWLKNSRDAQWMPEGQFESLIKAQFEAEKGSLGTGAATQGSPTKASPKKFACEWVAFNNVSYEHLIDVDVNGKHMVSFHEEGSGFDCEPSPLKEGKNTVRIGFSIREGKEVRSGSKLQMLLSPTMMPGTDPLPGFDVDTKRPYAECVAEITMKDKVPGLLVFTLQEWSDKERKHLLSEEKVETDICKKVFDKVWVKVWTEDGNPFSEEYNEGGRLRSGKYFKPGGALGTEVKDGKGVRREYFEDGKVAVETPYSGGLKNGQEREFGDNGRIESSLTFKDGVRDGECLGYDEKGKLAIRGTFKAGQKHGTWIRYGTSGKESARSEFDHGKLVKGTDPFDEISGE